MSNLWLNWRFGAHHLQIVRWGDWYKCTPWLPPISFGYNPWQADRAMTREKLFSRKAWGEWFEVM